jgi:hypothetical protein
MALFCSKALSRKIVAQAGAFTANNENTSLRVKSTLLCNRAPWVTSLGCLPFQAIATGVPPHERTPA